MVKRRRTSQSREDVKSLTRTLSTVYWYMYTYSATFERVLFEEYGGILTSRVEIQEKFRTE